MKRTRIILSLLVVALTAFQIVFTHYRVPTVANYAGHIASSVLTVAALTILGFSFFRINETMAGDFCFAPDNPWWKFMLNWYGAGWWGQRVSLCRAYWSVVFIVALGTGLSTVAGFGLFVVIPGIFTDLAHWINHTPLKEIGIQVGIVAGVGAALISIVASAAWLSDKFKVLRIILKYAGMTLLISMFAFILFVAPVMTMRQRHRIEQHTEMPITQAATIHAGHLAIGISITFGAVLLIWAAFKFLPALKETWLARLILNLKSKTCPILAACDDPDGSYAG